MTSTAVGIIGCGNISSIYLENCHQRFRGIHVAAVADIDISRAQARAAEYGVAKARVAGSRPTSWRRDSSRRR